MKRGPRIGEDVQVKICDMGNGCWTYHHFTPEIQTRQYRSPEVIIGADYNTSADIWSFACTIFEMVTGDFLFEPRKGDSYDKDDDHLAQMMELLGRMPKNLALSGKHSKKFFDSKGNLRKISGLSYWPVKKVLMEKYLIKENEAQAFADFMGPMLEWHHDRRASAQKMLEHPWLKMPANYDYKYSEKEFQIMQLKRDMKGTEPELTNNNYKLEMNELIDSEPEEYQPDLENIMPNERGSVAGLFSEQINSLFTDRDNSLQLSRERTECVNKRKANDVKLNNSFTGPYPTDPTEFGHNDKGANAQFAHFFNERRRERSALEKSTG